jgi:5-methylcytosine-specific restriction enzyme subunit McrC
LSLSDTKTEFEDQPDLVEAIVAGFVLQIRHALRPGLLQGYRVEEDALTTIRGRIRIEAQLGKRFGVTPPIEVRYDDFTVDIEENRIIKAALARLSRMRLRSERSRRDLRSFGAALSNVTTVEYQQLPEFAFTRLNLRYEPAVRLAGLILRSTSYDLTRGGVTSSSFLIDMNRVFEDFVVHSLRDELHLTEREFPQGGVGHRLTFDVAGHIRLKPDISWWRGGRCVFVGDVKYKKTIEWRVPNADLYQLHAYATATDLPGGLLIYAAGEDEPGIHTVRYAGKRLEVAALGLAGPPEQVLGDIGRVADRIRTLRNEVSEKAA